MKLVNHEPIIGISKLITSVLSLTVASLFFNILNNIDAILCFAHIFIFILGALFICVACVSVAIPKNIYDWPICSKILAHCGLFSYITLWNIIKPGDYISFANIKYDGTSDEPISMDTVFWGVVHKGTSYIQISTSNGNKVNLLPYEFSQKVAEMMSSHNTILMNGKKIYSNLDNIMPKVKWITY